MCSNSLALTVAQRLEDLSLQAGLRNDLDGGELLLQLRAGRDPLLAKTVYFGATLLHYACQHGWLDFVIFLVQNHNCNLNAVTWDGGTPLHYACRYSRCDIVRYLITELHCYRDCRDKFRQTPLHWLIGNHGKCTQEEALEVLRFLISTAGCLVNAMDAWGNTAFLLACQHWSAEVARYLISEAHCDVTLPNKNGDTALHVACCDNKKKKISKLLLEETDMDPNVRNSNGNTPLHLAVRNVSEVVPLLARGTLKMSNTYRDIDADRVACKNADDLSNLELLLEEAKIDPNVKNNDGDTPLHLACESEKFSVVQLLVRDERCNPHEKNSNSDTALHVACRHKSEDISTLKLLLEEAKIDPNGKNNDGDTPLHLACENEKFAVVQLLVKDERCNPHEKNSNGDTALHVACRHNGVKVAELVLEETKSDPNVKNNERKTPLDLTSNTDLIRVLIRHGANPRDVYKYHGNVLGRAKQPLQTRVKLFMVGNPSAGKSTLTKALLQEGFGLKRIANWMTKVSGVDKKTAGIVPHEFESKTYGPVTLYDFAGQREFYGSHAALLQNAIQTSTPIFLLVIDLSESNDVIKRNIFYWLSFLDNQCTSLSSKPRVLVIGSHVDSLKSREDPKHKASFITALLTTSQFTSLEFTGFIAMDCQYADSAGMRVLHLALKRSCDLVRTQQSIDFNAHCFLVYLLDKFRDHQAVTIDQILSELSKDVAASSDITYYLPQSHSAIAKVCDQLNDRGHLLFLKDSTAVENSWVIIAKTTLLAEVNGTIFAPEGFKEHIKLASSTGVVALSNIAKHFPNHPLAMLLGFLSHLEFCYEISDTEILGLINQEQASSAVEETNLEGERYFFFPGLVTLEVPSTVWEPHPLFEYENHCGWILQCSRPEQFFGPRFIQVLLLRLAFCFAFRTLPSADVPSLQRKCSIWKNGIYWSEGYGNEVLVEVAEQNRVAILMRSGHVNSEYFRVRSLLIQKVLAAAREFCSKVSTCELFINPSDTTQYPLKPTSRLMVCDITEVATAVAKGMPSVVQDTGKSFPLNSLLSFEPYADLGEPILRELFAEGNRRQVQIPSIADCIPDRNTEMIKKIFKPSPTKLQERMYEASIASQVYHVLDMWRDSCEGTYQCLREKLDHFSVFAGRNPLEIAGLSCESKPQPTADSAAVTTEDTTAMEHGSFLLVVEPDHVDGLAAVLDDLAGSWYRFTGLLGLSDGKRRQIQLNNAGKPDLAQLCLLDTLHLWVKSDEGATYEKITTVLQKHFPSRSLPLITAVREFAEEHSCSVIINVSV